MPLVAALFTAFFTKIFEFFGSFVTKRIALAGAAITVFITILAALWLLIRGLIVGVLIAWPPATGMWLSFYVGLSLIMPPNLDAIISTVIAGDTAIFLYRWNLENVYKTPLHVT